MSLKVTIYTRAYNTKPYLEQCISSVLAQSYPNFEYILIDNGCTDGSSQIMADYAAADKRIRLIRYEENHRVINTRQLIHELGTGDYITILDSDDWWEPEYLAVLMDAAEKTDADIISTGTLIHTATGQTRAREIERRLILDREEFAEGFPPCHLFFRTVWAKLIRTSLYLTSRVPPEKLEALGSTYGSDTLSAFACLQQAKRICLDNSVLHHYRIHEKSVSYQYDAKRFQSDVYLYHEAIDFLVSYGPISRQNREYLQCVFANAVSDTVGVIQASSLSPADKLQEYHTIAAYPLTRSVYHECKYDVVSQSRAYLLQAALQAGVDLDSDDDSMLRTVVQLLLPRCGLAVTKANIPMFMGEPDLLQALFQDDPEPILNVFLARVAQNQDVKKYAIPEAIQALSINNPLLYQIKDTVFLQKYAKVYLMIWRGENLSALDLMTGLLLENQVNDGREVFLQLYIALAALEDQAPAFVFGKLQLAELFLQQDHREECRAVVDELTEIGIDNDELAALRRELESIP